MMKKHLWLAVLCAVVQMAGSSAFAAARGSNTSPTWELNGAFGNINLSSQGTNTTTINLLGTVGYFFAPQWEVTANPYLNIVSQAATTTTFNLSVGALYNFMSDIANSAFVGAGPGLAMVNSAASTTNFSFFVEAGKRFAITDSVTWTPFVTFTDVTSTPSQTTFNIVPLSFSLLF